MTRTFLVLALGLLTALPAFPQDTADVDSVLQDETPGADVDAETAPPRKTATAVRITDEIVVDGRLDEPAWASAFPATGFVQRSPFRGRPASEPTEVRFLYDEDNLYVGVICFDSEPSRIVVNDLDYDFNFRGSDNIEIAIDSLLSLRSAFYFRFNPAGAKSDAQISDQRYNYDWDGVWDVRTSINDNGWIAEVVIPFKTLRFSRASTQVWGINMGQKRIRLNEDTFWFDPLLPIRYSLLRTSLFGTLEGLDNMSQGHNVKITPFVTAGVTQVRSTAEPAGHFATTQDYDGGLDLKYSLTPSLTLDATYRTDFAHVEVDQQQVNLTRFGLFFPEKRDFFLENSGTFSFGAGNNLVPFFSRPHRIEPGRHADPDCRGHTRHGAGRPLRRGCARHENRAGGFYPFERLLGRACQTKSLQQFVDRRVGHQPRLLCTRGLQPGVRRRRLFPVLRAVVVRFAHPQERNAWPLWKRPCQAA